MVQMSMPEAFRALNTCSQIAPPMPVKAMQAPMMVPEFWLNHLLHSVGNGQPQQTDFAKAHHKAGNVEDPKGLHDARSG